MPDVMKRFTIYLHDLTDNTAAEFIKFLGGENGNHDVIPIVVYETVCERYAEGKCDPERCGDEDGWECDLGE
jgi:hypothetical protein